MLFSPTMYQYYTTLIYILLYLWLFYIFLAIQGAPRSKAYVSGRSNAGIAGSNPTAGTNVYLL
jgi:hypothetical protein